ncbi:hypothetical protein ACF0H5_018895 [Mactra antiquata]
MFLFNYSVRLFRSVSSVFSMKMTQEISSESKYANCKRLMNVIGSEGKSNNIIVCLPENSRQCKQHVIYFGGDVQDYIENMENHYTNQNYAKWNLESTAQLLQSKFKDSTVIVVKPSKMLLKTFSIYENFLSFDVDGLPEFDCDSGALLHLSKLYNNVINKLSDENLTSSKSPGDIDVDVKIVGFSKGCVVLTKLMFELKTYENDKTVQDFLKKVSTFCWLDGGHNGRKHAYITDDAVVKYIKDLDKQIYVLVTPYQVQCPNRKWIGREERQFVYKLEAMNAKVKEYQFFMDDPPSIENHFQVLTKVDAVD